MDLLILVIFWYIFWSVALGYFYSGYMFFLMIIVLLYTKKQIYWRYTSFLWNLLYITWWLTVTTFILNPLVFKKVNLWLYLPYYHNFLEYFIKTAVFSFPILVIIYLAINIENLKLQKINIK